jgi:hypothetical protein
MDLDARGFAAIEFLGNSDKAALNVDDHSFLRTISIKSDADDRCFARFGVYQPLRNL